tara:strand:- start:513 stop:1070 length:558 start_codon:yes stop_codon:yes gene_type:complete
MNSFADRLKSKTTNILQDSAKKISDSALEAIEEVGNATVDAAEAVVQNTVQTTANATKLVASNAANSIKENANSQQYANNLSQVLTTGGAIPPGAGIDNAEEITVIAKLKGGAILTVTTNKGFTLKKAPKKGKKVLKAKKPNKVLKAKKAKKTKKTKKTKKPKKTKKVVKRIPIETPQNWKPRSH